MEWGRNSDEGVGRREGEGKEWGRKRDGGVRGIGREKEGRGGEREGRGEKGRGEEEKGRGEGAGKKEGWGSGGYRKRKGGERR